MQEWMIAMLVISVLLILRDMAKTIFSEMKKSAATLAYEQHPQKEKMQRYAESFQKLANSFYGMPYRKVAFVWDLQEDVVWAELETEFRSVLSENLQPSAHHGGR